jgi:hypothetical protein
VFPPPLRYLEFKAVTQGGACEADFEKNGLNYALRERLIGNVAVYVAGRDAALRLARNWWAGLLGYGTLGLHGAKNVAPDVRRYVIPFTQPKYGHSDWFNDSNFDQTLSLLTVG